MVQYIRIILELKSKNSKPDFHRYNSAGLYFSVYAIFFPTRMWHIYDRKECIGIAKLPVQHS